MRIDKWLYGGMSLVAGSAIAVAGAQCPNGTPPPCGPVRRVEPVSRAAPPPAAVRVRRILLLPFRNVTRAPAQDWLVSGGPIMLAAALGQFRDLTVVPEEKLTVSLRRASIPADGSPDAAQLRRIADETGGWTAVSGTVIASGGKLRVGVQALDVATTQVLTRLEGEIAADADVRLAFDTLAARLLAITGIRSSATQEIGGLTTRSVDAFQEYVAGMDALKRAEGRQAIERFRRAVRLDSTFALAWARLGLAAVIWDGATALDPRSEASIAVERAGRFTGRLPPREERLILGMQNAIAGRIGANKALLDSMITADSSDVEAREYRAVTELFDLLILDTLAVSPRIRGSWNAAARMFEDVLQRDPGRVSAYQWLTWISLQAAGGGTGQGAIPALRREASSIAALLSPSTFVIIVPVLRDSIEFMTMGGWLALSPTQGRAMQLRAAEVGQRWSDRWIAVAPTNPSAHLRAAFLADRLGQHARTLREIALVDTTRTFANPLEIAMLRVRALTGLGQLDAATGLADSIRTSTTIAPGGFQALANVTVLRRLQQRQWEAAMALVDTAIQRMPARMHRCNYFQGLASIWSWPMPLSLRAAVMDTVVSHFLEVAETPSIAPCAMIAGAGLAADSAGMRREFGLRRAYALFDSAAAIPGAHGDAVLVRAGTLARVLDSVNVSRLRANDRYVRLVTEYAMHTRFEPAGAVVGGDSVSVGFRWSSREPGAWDMPEANLGWTLRARIRVGQGDDTTHVVIFGDHPWASRPEPVRGGVKEAAAALTIRAAGLSRPLPGFRASQWPAELRVEGDVIRLVVRGELVDAIRRSHPQTAQFGLLPCVVVKGGLCGSPSLAIEYR